MCWLCDQAYKRVLAKTKKSQEFILKTSKSVPSFLAADSPNKSNTPTSHEQVFPPIHSTKGMEGMTVLERLTKIATSGGSSRGNTPPIRYHKFNWEKGDHGFSFMRFLLAHMRLKKC